MKTVKRLFGLLLALCLLASMLPTVTLAASESDLTFTLNGDGESYCVTDCNQSASGELVIPATYNGKPVTSIGYSAFSNCRSLTTITIPDSVTSIYSNAFEICSSLTGIWVGVNNPQYSNDGNGALFNKDKTELLTVPGGLTGSYIIPDSVTSIGNYAFYNCSSLTSIIIPDSVTSIGNRVFSNCGSLTSITIPDSVISIGSYTFFSCSNLTSINIPDSVTSISFDAFSYCSSLTSITIPDSVTSIDNWAFSYCSGLTSITIPDSVTNIGYNAFCGCNSLKDIYYNGTTGQWNTVEIDDGNNYLTAASVTYLKGLGGYCGENVSWTLNEKGVLTISGTGDMDNWSFYNSPWYAERSTVKKVVIEEGVTGIGKYAFYDCTRLTSIEIPASVISIGENAFRYCERLSGIWVDENNPSYCSDSTGILFNKDKTILLQAPARLSGSYMIPGTVTEIADGAFLFCQNLTEVIIPDSVLSIGAEAFYDCLELNRVTYYGTEEQWEQIAISEDNEALTDAEIKFLNGALPNEFAAIVLDRKGNVIGRYATIDEAVAAAQSSEKIVLQKDAQAEDLILLGGVTLDLNGHTLTVDSILTFKTANVVDGSADSTGLLKINDEDGNMIRENNAQLPVYDKQKGGYRFFAITVTSHTITGKESATPKYWFTIDIGNFDQLYDLYQAGADLQIQAKLTWTQLGGDMVCATYATANMQFTSKWIEDYHNGNQLYICVSVENSTDLDNFALTPCVSSGDFQITGEEM